MLSKIYCTYILPEVFRYRSTIVLLALPRPALLGKLVVSIVYMLTLLYFIIACCYNGHLQMIAGICNQLRQLQQQHGTFSHWARASNARCPWQQGELPRSPARGVYQSYKTQHSVPINKCVPSWAGVEAGGEGCRTKPMATGKGERMRGRRRTQRGLSIYATVRWTLLLLTISCCCGKVDKEGCVREGGERGRGREREKSDRARAAHGLKRTRHVFVTYYIFIATNEPLNARTRREGGARRGGRSSRSRKEAKKEEKRQLSIHCECINHLRICALLIRRVVCAH